MIIYRLLEHIKYKAKYLGQRERDRVHTPTRKFLSLVIFLTVPERQRGSESEPIRSKSGKSESEIELARWALDYRLLVSHKFQIILEESAFRGRQRLEFSQRYRFFEKFPLRFFGPVREDQM